MYINEIQKLVQEISLSFTSVESSRRNCRLVIPEWKVCITWQRLVFPHICITAAFPGNTPAEIEVIVQSDDPSRKIYFLKGGSTGRTMLAENKIWFIFQCKHSRNSFLVTSPPNQFFNISLTCHSAELRSSKIQITQC